MKDGTRADSEFLDARETIVVGTSVAAIVLAAIYWVSRIGFDNPVAPVALSLGLSLFLCAAPLWLTRIARREHVGKGNWWSSQAALTLACLVLTAIAGIGARGAGTVLALVIALAGFGLAAFTLVRWLPRGRPASTILFLAGSVLFTIWSAGVTWGSRYKMPLYWETLSFRANVHHDPLYYASMANMLETYGVASTGLDGLPVIHYHYGSAWLYAKWADLIGTDVLTFYSLGYPIVVIPLFLGALLLLAVELRFAFGRDEASASLRGDYRTWLVVAAATIGLIPTSALDALTVWNANVLVSESYLIGIPVLLLVIGAALAFWLNDARRAVVPRLPADTDKAESGPARGDALVFLLVFIPVSLAVLGFLKVSLMLILFGVALYFALRLGLWKRWMGVAACVAGIVAVSFTYSRVSLASHNGGVSWLNFLRFEVVANWQQFFPLVHMLWSWLYIAGRLWEEGIRDFAGLREAFRARRILDVEFVALVALLGFLPGEVFSIHGGSAIYFSDVQRWVALSFILSRLGIWVRHWRATQPGSATSAPGRGFRAVRLSTLLAIVVAAPFAVTLALNTFQWPLRVLRANVALRRELLALGGKGAASSGVRALADRVTLAEGLRRTTYYPLVSALREIRALPLAERRRAALFIPQSNRLYWGMFDADDRCDFVSLVAPAVSSVAMIDGMPAAGCKMTTQYNMTVYTSRSRPQLPSDTTRVAVCARARAKGFDEVIVLNAGDGRTPRRYRIECGS
ncbi:MAG: hypothetical protein Q7S20_10820 [Gemmatimonadaceae bacterium]|nr:hypothetical protein [Gemmatimonadaceae bacterium]